MALAAFVMFLFASLDVAFHLRHNLDVFVSPEKNPVEEFSKTADWINVMSMGCYVGQTFVGDSILLYRCWIIWSRNWYVVVAPAVFWLAGTVCGILTIHTEATLHNNDALLNAHKIVPFITSMLSLTLVTNLLTTGLMVYRIQRIRQRMKHRSDSATVYAPLTNVMRLLIEAGLLYTTSIVILFIFYMLSNNAQYGVSNAIVQIIGITFNLIITRVDRGEATQPTSQNTPTMAGTVALQTISIQTTIASRSADPVYHKTTICTDDLEAQSVSSMHKAPPVA